MTGARPPRQHTDDHELSDADRIVVLRAALQKVAPVLDFYAGWMVADDPKQTALLLATADDVRDVLARTGSSRGACARPEGEAQM
ncbi:hypothetical protein [Streptomyces sp. NPDC053720]|uniref:hypothetical protein n=1 Tax=Streptomyces sp. NPDC053720 TaxID=3154855 RepID=UPI00341FEDB8